MEVVAHRGFGIGLLSFLMAGRDGTVALFHLLIGFASPWGLSTSSIDQMMNWRGLAVNLDGLLPAPLWSLMALGASVVIGVIAIGLWRAPAHPKSAKYARLWLGTYAAKGLVAWHSHVHMALPLLAPAIFAWGDSAWKSRPLAVWLFLPVAVYLTYFYVFDPIAILVGRGVGPNAGLVGALPGLSLFIVNLVMVCTVWSGNLQRQVRLGNHHNESSE